MKAKLIAFALFFVALAGYGQSKYGSNPDDSLKCLENLSLFNEFYKQNNFVDAYQPWKRLVKLCPSSTKNLYIKGNNMLQNLVAQEKDEAKKEQLIDTLLMAYDMRIENFGQEAYVIGRKSAELLKFKSNQPELAFEAAKTSFEGRGTKTEAGVLQTYYLALKMLVEKGEKEESMMIQEFPKLMEVVNANKDGKYGKYYLQVESALQDIFAPYATCESLVELYQDKFNSNPSDTVIQKEILKFFEMRNCTDEELFMKAAQEYDKVNPSAKSKLSIGIGLLKKSDYSGSINYLKEATAMTEDKDIQQTAYKYLSYASLRTKSYASVKNYAYKWSALDEGNGEPYKLIGDAYFYGSTTVGENPCEKAFGYIASVDKYYRAKQLSPELAADCNRMIGQAQANFPKKEKCFFHGITDGQTKQVGGWINENITVKTIP